ncbi:MAG: winged helix-turn-helix transcriptional regulator [Candidatus Methanoperedens sp.]|nr:winged helix-turn-helix transcriptional regulator [Candidatus Methanoperedens sp.]
MCFLCQNSRTEEEYQNRRKEAIEANSHTAKANSIIDELKTSLKNEKLQFSKIIDQKDWELEDLHKDNQKLNEENSLLRQKCTQRPKEYINHHLEIQCPYCDHMETIESTGEETIRVSDILSTHLSEMHVPPSLIATKAVQPRCGSCLINFENMERVRKDLNEKKAALSAAVTTYEWIFMGEDENEVAYVGCIDGETTIGLIKVKRNHLIEIPVRVEKGQCIFTDGTSYPLDLIKTLKNKKLSPHKTVSKEVTHTLSPSDLLNEKPQNLPIVVSTIPLSVDSPTDSDGSESVSADTDSADIEEVVSPSTAVVDVCEVKLSPNENKVLAFVKDHPDLHKSEIARTLEMDPSNLSRYIKSLWDKKVLKVSEEGQVHVI